MRTLADEKCGNCCVCGNVVKVTEASTPKDIIVCTKLCHQLLIFFQGLICGHALCSLLRHSDKVGREPVSQLSETDFVDCRESRNHKLEIDEQTCNLVKTEPHGADSKAKCDTDPESNVLEELLQVTFDQNYDADTDSDIDTQDDTQQLLASPCSSASASLTTEGLPSIDTLRIRSQQAITNQTNSCKPMSIPASFAQCVTKKRKRTFHKKRVTRKKINAVLVTLSDDHLDDFSNRDEDNSAAGSGKRRVECGVCGEKFIETHLYVHMKAKHIEKLTKEESDLMFSCTECNKKFDKQSHLNKHLAKKHPSCKKLTKSCTICHKGFSNQIGLSVHMRHVHKALSPKECDLCQRTFKSCKELSRHKLSDHKLRVHICHLCGKNFAYGHALKSHLDAHAGVKKHFCEVCGEGFVRMTSLCGHRISAHSKKDDVVHKCEICESTFSTKALLNKHLFETHFTGPYAVKNYRTQGCVTQDQNCQSCKNTVDNSGKCPLHSADNSKQFICSHCGKNFSKSHYLKAHEKQHQEAKFSCDICCKRFTYKCNLKAHRSTHSSDKPFQCTVCSKKFRLKFLLEDHQRTHNRDLLFKCYICGRGLTRIPNLKRHIRVMHPEVSYEQHIFGIHEDS